MSYALLSVLLSLYCIVSVSLNEINGDGYELDNSNNIKFIYKVEQGGQLVTISRSAVKQDRKWWLKLQIYRKPTHTDQYLNFSSHHPTEHKLSVVRTLLERSQCLVTEIEDRKQEDSHVKEALQACGYPKWTFNKVRCQTESKWDKKTRQQCDSSQQLLFLMWKTFLKPLQE